MVRVFQWELTLRSWDLVISFLTYLLEPLIEGRCYFDGIEVRDHRLLNLPLAIVC